ncbi:hypothetical protein C5167_027396 [Papaver somniferum]|uniref:probable WRKY transcription factor 41 n=1 Tax=Papaver somniferum TaxID=3469 RepID=UPI000E6F61ED|nr:probable WRKY transcription factor 41 [Papaver somniferum]RZC91335.1 hypothetical protein C5167_027396 [Papaver somniferum]
MSDKSNEMMLGLDHKPLIMNEIIQARELVKELQTQLNPISSSSRKVLITRILSSFETSLSMLDRVKLENESGHVTGRSISDCESDLSGDGSRKRCRKKLTRWTQKVRVCEQTGLEGPIDDGYSWRKYGQKDILGAKYPRGYYKCTFQKNQGCSAMKQVQRSELDSSIFNVTYIGRHSCVEGSELVSPEKCSPIKQEANNHINNQESREKKSPQETFISFQTSSYHRVVKEEKDFGNHKELDSFPSFSFPPLKVENHFFETTSTNSSPTYISTPTTAESKSNYNLEGRSGEQNTFENTADSHDSKIDEMIVSSPEAHAISAANDSPTTLDSCWDWDFLVDYSPSHFL